MCSRESGFPVPPDSARAHSGRTYMRPPRTICASERMKQRLRPLQKLMGIPRGCAGGQGVCKGSHHGVRNRTDFLRRWSPVRGTDGEEVGRRGRWHL
jgi:hypothetical protein